MRKQTGLGDRDSSENIELVGWERLPNESSRAYGAFAFYRDMRTGRSLTKVAKNLNPGRPISVSAVSQWASKYRWRQRCWKFDYNEQQEAEKKLARQRRAARERQIRIGMSLQAIGTQGLLELQKKLEAGVPLNLTMAEILTLAQAGARLERQSLGEVRDRSLTEIRVVHNGAPPDDPGGAA